MNEGGKSGRPREDAAVAVQLVFQPPAPFAGPPAKPEHEREAAGKGQRGAEGGTASRVTSFCGGGKVSPELGFEEGLLFAECDKIRPTARSIHAACTGQPSPKHRVSIIEP